MRYRLTLLFSILTLLYSCSEPDSNNSLPVPQIKAGIAKVSGTLRGAKELSLAYTNTVTAEECYLTTVVSEKGSFSFEVPVECPTIGVISPHSIAVGLIPNEETIVETQLMNFKTNCSLGLAPKDVTNLTNYEMWDKLSHPTPNEGDFYFNAYTLSHDDFSKMAIEMLEKRIEYVLPVTKLTKTGRDFVANEIKLHYLKGCLLDYSEYVSLSYRNSRVKDKPESFTPQEPNKSYYRFLKYFNLNDPQYLYNSYYWKVLRTILSIDTLGIPDIKDTPIDEWLGGVKATMADMIGSDTGLFYDMLTANAYARQLSMTKPFSEKQKENIGNYFKDEEIGKILLVKNEEIIKQDEESRKYFSLNIEEITLVAKEELLKTIVSK